MGAERLPVINQPIPIDIASGYSVPCQVIGDIREILRNLLRMDKLAHQWDLGALPSHRKKLYHALTPLQKSFSPHHALWPCGRFFRPTGFWSRM